MDLRTKLLCGILGALLIIIGMLIALLGFVPVTAQQSENRENLGNIAVTSLDVVDEDGERRLSLSADKSGGTMIVYGEGYFKPLVVLHGDADKGAITIHGDTGKPAVSIKGTPEGGAIGISENEAPAETKAMMIIRNNEGTFAVADKDGKWYTSKQQYQTNTKPE